MTTAFVGILIGVILVSAIGVLSALAARRHKELTITTTGKTQGVPNLPGRSEESLSPTEFAAVGAGQGNDSGRAKRDKMASAGKI